MVILSKALQKSMAVPLIAMEWRVAQSASMPMFPQVHTGYKPFATAPSTLRVYFPVPKALA